MSTPLGYPVVGPNASTGVTYGPQNVAMNPQIAAQIAAGMAPTLAGRSNAAPSQIDLSLGLAEGTTALLYPQLMPSYLSNIPGAGAGGASPLAGQTVQSMGWQGYVPASQQQYYNTPAAGPAGAAQASGGAGNAQLSSLMQELQSLMGGGALGAGGSAATSNPMAQFQSQLHSILGAMPAASTGLSSTAPGYTAPQLPSSFDTAGLDPSTVAGMNVFMKQYLPQIVGSTALQGLGQGAQAEAAANAGEQAFVPLVQADIANRQKQEALGLQGLGLQTSYGLGQEGLGLQGLQLQADVGQRQEALGLQGIQTALEGYGMQQQAGMDIANLGQQGFQNLLSLFTPAALPRDVSLQQSAASQNEIARLQNLVQQYVLGPLGGAVVPSLGQSVTSSGGK
jgi:hypothetical protein